MYVLFYGPFPKGRFPGGITFISECLKNNSEYLSARGIKLSFINSSPVYRNDSSQGKLRFQNIRNFIKVREDLNNCLRKGKYEIIHFNSSVRLALLKDLLLASEIRRKFPCRIIFHIHYADGPGIFFKYTVLNKIVLYLISRNIDHLILLSSGLRHELKKLLPSGFKMSVINNFHFIPEYNKVPEKIPHQLLYLGSIDERKGFHDLLDALEIVSGVGYQLKAAGSFLNLHFKHRVEEKIRTDSLRVEILGYIKGAQKIKLLEESSILVLPSYQEGLPIVILEAMASGCALITTKAGAIGEILNGNNALFIEPGNIRNLASAITRLLSDETLRKKYQVHNLKQSRRYSFGNFCRNISDVYLSNNCLS